MAGTSLDHCSISAREAPEENGENPGGNPAPSSTRTQDRRLPQLEDRPTELRLVPLIWCSCLCGKGTKIELHGTLNCIWCWLARSAVPNASAFLLLVCTRVRFFCLFVLAGWQAAGCSTQSCDLIVISSSVQVMSDSCSCGERVLEVCIAFPIY